jgi:hypothetical protein
VISPNEKIQPTGPAVVGFTKVPVGQAGPAADLGVAPQEIASEDEATAEREGK